MRCQWTAPLLHHSSHPSSNQMIRWGKPTTKKRRSPNNGAEMMEGNAKSKLFFSLSISFICNKTPATAQSASTQNSFEKCSVYDGFFQGKDENHVWIDEKSAAAIRVHCEIAKNSSLNSKPILSFAPKSVLLLLRTQLASNPIQNSKALFSSARKASQPKMWISPFHLWFCSRARCRFFILLFPHFFLACFCHFVQNQ